MMITILGYVQRLVNATLVGLCMRAMTRTNIPSKQYILFIIGIVNYCIRAKLKLVLVGQRWFVYLILEGS